MGKKTKLTKQELFHEIRESIDNLESFLEDIIKDKKMARIKPLSVELRKLLVGGRGNAVLKRAEEELEIKLRFPDRAKVLPPRTIEVGLDDYINRLVFALGGRGFTRKKLIYMVAEQKGAHIEKQPDILHRQSKRIILPLGNPARGGSFFEQNHRYLISIARTVSIVVKEQILDCV